jgi:hypothetical protein
LRPLVPGRRSSASKHYVNFGPSFVRYEKVTRHCLLIPGCFNVRWLGAHVSVVIVTWSADDSGLVVSLEESMMKLPGTMCTILGCVAAVAACGGDDATETGATAADSTMRVWIPARH